MPDLIRFADALQATENQDRALIIGNGFSARYFDYATLLEKSGIEPTSALRKLFDGLKTVDFEAVIRALEGAIVVEQAYGNDSHAAELAENAKDVRAALVRAVNTTHPLHREELAFNYESSSDFLENFGTVFSLNYDLLLYWVNLEKTLLNDGFGLGRPTSDGTFHGPFKKNAYCHVFNLHGGLHLFQDDDGKLFKALDSGAGVMATIAREIRERGRLPVYVAEGTSTDKMNKINSVDYLRHGLQKLRENTSATFVFGHSADENDSHIYEALFCSQVKSIYFGVYEPTIEKMRVLDARLSMYQRASGSSTIYTFYDAKSACVWEAG